MKNKNYEELLKKAESLNQEVYSLFANIKYDKTLDNKQKESLRQKVFDKITLSADILINIVEIK
jgi:hypothetical protein